MSAMDRIGQPALTDFVLGQMTIHLKDLSLALVDGQGFRTTLVKIMPRPIAAVPSYTSVE